ncbi:MAG: hypothetical protein J6Y37_01145 [Paludibacteraceae bacterium]|nr:hypothetical protein [Paludibacteraceae bacterium]
MADILKDAQGDDLPELDREVIVLVREYGGYVVCFGHRPVKDRPIITGNGEELFPKVYGKGEWNIPDVAWWVDIDLSIIE